MNKVLQDLKTALTKAREAALEAQAENAAIESYLSGGAIDASMDAAAIKAKREASRAKLNAARAAVMDAIEKADAEAMAQVDKWARLDPADIKDDIQLLNGAFTLSSAELNELADKHSKNYTMLRAIKDYGDKNGIYMQVYDPAEVKRAWKTVLKETEQTLNYVLEKPDSQFSEIMVREFGQSAYQKPGGAYDIVNSIA